MLKKLSEKLGAKFPATTPGCSMLKTTRLDDAFSEVFKLQASPVEGQSLQQKQEKRSKRKGEKKNFMPESQCTKERCWWQERQAAVLQTLF